MKSIDFFNKLIDKCKYIPESKLEKIIYFYRNEIDAGLSHGQTEEEIIKNFGDIDKITHDINTETEIFINTKLNTSINKNIQKNQFIEDKSNKNYNSSSKETKHYSFSKLSKIILKVILLILAFAVIIPIFTTIIGFIFGVLCIFIIILMANIYFLFNILILNSTFMLPRFLLNFPENSLVFFSLGFILLSLFFIILIFYIIKSIILYFVKFYNSEKHMGGSI